MALTLAGVITKSGSNPQQVAPKQSVCNLISYIKLVFRGYRYRMKGIRNVLCCAFAFILLSYSVALEDKPLSRRDRLVKEVFSLTNEARKKKGLAALEYDDRLEKSAQWMAGDMANKNYFSHEDSFGRTIGQRIPSFGYTDYAVLKENIAAGYTSAKEVVDSWLESPGHYKNIMCPKSKHLGIGFSENRDSKFKLYWVQNFGAELE